MKKAETHEAGCSRRSLLKGMGLLLVGGQAPPLLATQARGGRGAQPQTGSTLVLLGTQGGPNINVNRSESASAVLVDGQPYLIDCGYGTLRALAQAAIRLVDVENVFITHLHDDHTADIAAFLTHKWTNGNTNPRPAAIHGPYGTENMVAGAIAFFKGNTEIRMVDEGRTVRPETIFTGHDLTAPKITEVFHDERVTVMAAENAHFPERAREKMPYRSFAYRLNTPTRSFVFSGDTAYSTGLIELARGADVFVCESMSMATRKQLEADRGGETGESITRHVIETHSTTEDVGKMATEAKVRTVVLNHIAGTASDSMVSEVQRFFSGEVVVGADQMRL